MDEDLQEDLETLEDSFELLDEELQSVKEQVNDLESTVNGIDIETPLQAIESQIDAFKKKMASFAAKEGKQGKDGKDGERGPKGLVGPQGAKGEPGPKGEKGEKGKDGETRILHDGGGNANRNIAIGGNGSVLSRYTDINLKPGSNVTITYANNNTTKYTDVTIAATGGGGTTRSINNISTSQTAGDTAGTDYVYLCTGTLTLTLPTAVGNENLYTVKNVGTGVVTIDTTGGETIDGNLTWIRRGCFLLVQILESLVVLLGCISHLCGLVSESCCAVLAQIFRGWHRTVQHLRHRKLSSPRSTEKRCLLLDWYTRCPSLRNYCPARS